MRYFSAFFKYLRAQQTRLSFILHLTVMLLVIIQLISSNFLSFTSSGQVTSQSIDFYGTWLHISSGLLVTFIGAIFIIVSFKTHGMKHFYPYLFSTNEQVKIDFKQLCAFRLPEPKEYGIANIVQGLGLGALLLVIFSGCTWFIGWQLSASWTNQIKELHELLTGLIEAYVIGHGGMGLLHIALRKTK